MEIQLIRHATMLITINGKKILLDPMLSPKGTLAAIPEVENTSSNPLTDLPVELESLINADAVMVTHMHRDHFDHTAIEVLPKDIMLFGQPSDAEKLAGYGFTNINIPHETYDWNDIVIYRTGGQHGRGAIGLSMGPVSGYVLQSPYEPSIYIVGDSILCDEVEQTLVQYQPDITVCFAGAAQFRSGGPITMTKQDVCLLAKKAPFTKVIVAHMESWNHCSLSRLEINQWINKQDSSNKIYVPMDGEIMSFDLGVNINNSSKHDAIL